MFLNNRYYNPTLGVFLSVDPLVGTTGDPYTYAGGNPTTRTDPTGLCAPDVGNDRQSCIDNLRASPQPGSSGPGTNAASPLAHVPTDTAGIERALYDMLHMDSASRAKYRLLSPSYAVAYQQLDDLMLAGLLLADPSGRLTAAGKYHNIDFLVYPRLGGGVSVVTRFGLRSRDNQDDQNALDLVSSTQGLVIIGSGFTCLATEVGCALFGVASASSVGTSAASTLNTCFGVEGGSACSSSIASSALSLATSVVPGSNELAAGAKRVFTMMGQALGESVSIAYSDTGGFALVGADISDHDLP